MIGSTAQRKHQWIYALPISELQALKEGRNAFRLVVNPAEKRIATMLLKQLTEGVKQPTPAQIRARLLGQCKFFLTGMQGNTAALGKLIWDVGHNNNSDIPPADLTLLQDKIVGLRKAVDAALQESLRLTTELSTYSTQPSRNPTLRKYRP